MLFFVKKLKKKLFIGYSCLVSLSVESKIRTVSVMLSKRIGGTRWMVWSGTVFHCLLIFVNIKYDHLFK